MGTPCATTGSSRTDAAHPTPGRRPHGGGGPSSSAGQRDRDPGDAAAGTEEPAAKATEDAPAGRADETDAEDSRTGEDPSPTGAKERGGSRTGR